MTDSNLLQAERLRLSENPKLNDTWLRERIVESPAILGLGKLCLADEGRMNDGRLELLLRDPASGERFTVLIRVGAAEDSDLVRALEQWTIERGRYPEHEHFAVVIAEQFPPRFLVAACALGESIPLSLMQFSTLRVAEQMMLNFIPVLDRLPRRRPLPTNGNGNGHAKLHTPLSRVLDNGARREQLDLQPATLDPDVRTAYVPRRRKRRNGGFFSFVCVLSLLLCVAAAAAWVRSYSVRDAYSFSSGSTRDHVIYSDRGSVEWILPAGGTPDGRERYVRVPYWLPISMTLILPFAWLVRGRSRFENP